MRVDRARTFIRWTQRRVTRRSFTLRGVACGTFLDLLDSESSPRPPFFHMFMHCCCCLLTRFCSVCFHVHVNACHVHFVCTHACTSFGMGWLFPPQFRGFRRVCRMWTSSPMRSWMPARICRVTIPAST